MKNLWQVFLGIIIALASLGLILGGFSLSLAEGNMAATLASTHTLTPTYSLTLQPFTPSTDSPTPSPMPSPTLTPTLSPTLPPTPTNCPPPLGWTPYVVQPGDTLDNTSTHYRISSTELQLANCLRTTELLPGEVIYVPPLPIPTRTPVPCGAPSTWIVYNVQPGDTLYHLSLSYGITVGDLQRANCMGSTILLRTGQTLYVPPWAPHTPTPTIPGVIIPTETPTNPPVTLMPSDTPTEAPTSTSTDTPYPVPSATPTEVFTETLIPTTP